MRARKRTNQPAPPAVRRRCHWLFAHDGRRQAGTLAALKHHRETVFDPAAARHRGRVVKLIGDGALVEFASVVDAVNCALAVQRAIKSQTRAGPNAIVLRIGINFGDVIIDSDDIYGDGVNLAARLEPLAEPAAFASHGCSESVANRVDAFLTTAGRSQSKTSPGRSGCGDGDPTASLFTGTGRGGADRARGGVSCVLPFTNISGDPEQEYFPTGSPRTSSPSSKISGLLVVARNSSFAYKGKNIDIRTIRHESAYARCSKARSARRNRVRITAQLVDAANGAHVGAELTTAI